MNYPYAALPGDPSGTKRPLIPVSFVHKNKATLPILCLVDSGADYSYLSWEIAEMLDINLNKSIPRTSFGINGSPFICFPSEITMEFGGVQLEIPVHFSRNLTKEFPCILGQEGFFNKAKITFERYKWNLDIRLI